MIRVLQRAERLFDLAVDKIAFLDRRRRIRRCSAHDGKLSYPSVQRAPRTSYFESEEVWKLAQQLSELRALPTIEPKRRLA
jgi:hypothetical protein